MQDVPEYYTILFRAVEQALRALDNQNYGSARQLLIEGEHNAEEAFLAADA
ncbi:putative uncharacterized protein [Firmicutes bacterium CAG:170]|nr:putative uncharacterized protein [Firmicutes bacterium CAG:170]